jgi:hypothetical protein
MVKYGLGLIALGLGIYGLMKLGNMVVPNKVIGKEYFTTGSDYKGNYVFGGAMQLAVNELNNNILRDKLQLVLQPSDAETNRLLTIFNLGEFTTNDLDAPSYYVKSGYGQKSRFHHFLRLFSWCFPRSLIFHQNV